MNKEQKEMIARETRKQHGIEMHGDIPAYKKSMAKKMSGHEHFYRHLSVGDKQEKCIHCGKLK